jgi:hypothetical protein
MLKMKGNISSLDPYTIESNSLFRVLLLQLLMDRHLYLNFLKLFSFITFHLDAKWFSFEIMLWGKVKSLTTFVFKCPTQRWACKVTLHGRFAWFAYSFQKKISKKVELRWLSSDVYVSDFTAERKGLFKMTMGRF